VAHPQAYRDDPLAKPKEEIKAMMVVNSKLEIC
jgi:hypothetical protein